MLEMLPELAPLMPFPPPLSTVTRMPDAIRPLMFIQLWPGMSIDGKRAWEANVALQPGAEVATLSVARTRLMVIGFPLVPLEPVVRPDEYDPPASQIVSPAFTEDQERLEMVQALFQSAPLFEPVALGRTYQLAANSVSGQNSSAINSFFIFGL